MQPGVLARIYFTGRNFLCYKLAISSPTSISLHHGPLPYQGSCIMNSRQKVSGEWHSESFLWPSILYCALSRFSHVQLFATLWTVAHHTPLSMGFSRQEYCSGLPCSPPGIPLTQGSSWPRDPPDPGIDPKSLCLLQWQAGSLPLAPPGNIHILVSVPSSWHRAPKTLGIS